jgi:hypothetical protein
MEFIDSAHKRKNRWRMPVLDENCMGMAMDFEEKAAICVLVLRCGCKKIEEGRCGFIR